MRPGLAIPTIPRTTTSCLTPLVTASPGPHCMRRTVVSGAAPGAPYHGYGRRARCTGRLFMNRGKNRGIPEGHARAVCKVPTTFITRIAMLWSRAGAPPFSRVAARPAPAAGGDRKAASPPHRARRLSGGTPAGAGGGTRSRSPRRCRARCTPPGARPRPGPHTTHTAPRLHVSPLATPYHRPAPSQSVTSSCHVPVTVSPPGLP